MAEKPSNLAIIALCLSVASVGFSVFQWWNSQRETKISAAIEFSKAFVREIDADTTRTFVTAYLGRDISEEDAIKMLKFSESLEYVAFLANREKIDKTYLSPSLICFIAFAERAITNVRKTKQFISDPSLSEIAKFKPHTECSDKERADQMIQQLPPQSN